MESLKKTMFINYLIWNPGGPNFKHKYELFSRGYGGMMMHLSSKKREIPAGNFTLTSIKYRKNVVIRQFLYALFCLRTAMAIRPLDYIIAYDPSICGVIGWLVRLVAGGKLVIEVNTNHLFRREQMKPSLFYRVAERIKLAMMSFTLRQADGIKFINKPITRNYCQVFGINGDGPKKATFFSYISTHAFKPSNDSQPYILLAGHPFDIKGVDVMIKAFQRVSPDYPELVLKIVGHCPDMAPYQRLADGNPNIQFLPGMPYDQIVPKFENCLFYVCASRTEGIPRVVIEAMASGKAVVGSDAGGIPEVIEDGVTGLLFQTENDQDLAVKMRLLLEAPAMRKSMGKAGIKRAAEVFSPSRYVALYHEFLESLG